MKRFHRHPLHLPKSGPASVVDQTPQVSCLGLDGFDSRDPLRVAGDVQLQHPEVMGIDGSKFFGPRATGRLEEAPGVNLESQRVQVLSKAETEAIVTACRTLIDSQFDYIHTTGCTQREDTNSACYSYIAFASHMQSNAHCSCECALSPRHNRALQLFLKNAIH